MKKLFNKKEKETLKDENGNPIVKEKEPGKVGGIVKKVLFGVGCAVVGVAAFLAVGAAIVCADEKTVANACSGTSTEPETTGEPDSTATDSNVGTEE